MISRTIPASRWKSYVFLLSADEAVRVVDSRRVLDQPSRTGEGWLWASDHVGLLTAVDLGP